MIMEAFPCSKLSETCLPRVTSCSTGKILTFPSQLEQLLSERRAIVITAMIEILFNMGV